MPDSPIRFRSVSKWFGTSQVLKGIDLTFGMGHVVVVCGPSGSGKSTLLRCINGLERVQEGQIEVLGQELTDRTLRSSGFRAEIGMVFQRFSLYPHMSVLQNVTLAPRLVRGTTAAAAKERAIRMLTRVGLADKVDAYPAELSGGQQQRVAIARALVMDPKIMLFDEPTSALDPEMIHEVLDVMRDLAASGMTMVIVTHEMGFAREVARRIIFMDEGEVVEDSETSAFFSAPATDRAQRFLDKILHH
ncbi:MAG: transporter related protein [Rubritepida sp.]|nr:transporter related protein [Rubritepida sp.]